jgi:hypothetical protein
VSPYFPHETDRWTVIKLHSRYEYCVTIKDLPIKFTSYYTMVDYCREDFEYMMSLIKRSYKDYETYVNALWC